MQENIITLSRLGHMKEKCVCIKKQHKGLAPYMHFEKLYRFSQGLAPFPSQEPFDKGVAQVVPPSPERVGAAPRDQARSRLAILTTPQVRPAWGYATSLPDNSTDLLPLVLVPESVNPPGPEMPLINWAEAEEDTGEGEVDLSIAKETPETVRRRGGFGEGSSYASLTSDATESDSEEGQSDQNASPKAFDEEDSFGGGTYWE